MSSHNFQTVFINDRMIGKWDSITKTSIPRIVGISLLLSFCSDLLIKYDPVNQQMLLHNRGITSQAITTSITGVPSFTILAGDVFYFTVDGLIDTNMNVNTSEKIYIVDSLSVVCDNKKLTVKLTNKYLSSNSNELTINYGVVSA